MPLAKQRMLERGYNQVDVFSTVLAHYRNVVHGAAWLSRSKETRSQVGLSLEDRKINMEGAFSAEEAMVGGKIILLMDDIMTTGASMNSAAKVLKQAGTNSVFALSVARADSHFEPTSDLDDQLFSEDQ